MRTTLTVHELEAFLLVADTCNFRRAAERLHVSQPALSRIIQSAESKLDARLFDRNTRHVELAPAGNELLPIARRIVAEFHDSLSDLSEFVAGRRGQITIACLPSTAALLPSVIAGFEKKYPNVSISLVPTSNDFVTDMVATGHADFGLSVAPSKSSQVEFEPFARDDFVLICGLGDPWAARRYIKWEMLKQRAIVGSGTASSIRPIVDRMLADHGYAVTPKYEVTNISVVGTMVAAGLGVAPIPRLALRLMDAGALKVLKITAPAIQRELGILTRNGRSLSAAATAFLESLRAARKHFDPRN
jgi:LysR family carnitine catabolism transcriptional activator